jgi:hypothetical protein
MRSKPNNLTGHGSPLRCHVSRCEPAAVKFFILNQKENLTDMCSQGLGCPSNRRYLQPFKEVSHQFGQWLDVGYWQVELKA